MVRFHHEAASMKTTGLIPDRLSNPPRIPSQLQIELQQVCFGCLTTKQSIATTQQCSAQVFKMIVLACSRYKSARHPQHSIFWTQRWMHESGIITSTPKSQDMVAQPLQNSSNVLLRCCYVSAQTEKKMGAQMHLYIPLLVKEIPCAFHMVDRSHIYISATRAAKRRYATNLQSQFDAPCISLSISLNLRTSRQL
jgi:hypothetical protein